MTRVRALVDLVWDGTSLLSRGVRALLAPSSWIFGAIVSRRNQSFDRAIVRRAAIPAISIGNLTVGGTGKTPIAAWCVDQLKLRGARPAIVMRGVGDDEWRVHALMNPGTPVVLSPDRTTGLVIARTRGADSAVLDDAFQHRQVARIADIVLLSADQWTGRAALLPAGPFREPLSSLRRASLVVVTTKVATEERVQELLRAIRVAAPDVTTAVVRLQAGVLRLAATLAGEGGSSRARGGPRADAFDQPTRWLAARTVVVVSAIANPYAFEAQVRAFGAQVKVTQRFPDHHSYTSSDALALAAHSEGTSGVICTLKDAVKLAPLWPREATPLWYLSQSVVVERGAEAFDREFARLLAARAGSAPTAG